jgi:hypothetical protein
VNFKEIKPLCGLCDELDEHLCCRGRHPVLRAEPVGAHCEIRYRERHYMIPADEVIVLPIGNSSAENLACLVRAHPAGADAGGSGPSWQVRELSIGVEETPGQRGIWTLRE